MLASAAIDCALLARAEWEVREGSVERREAGRLIVKFACATSGTVCFTRCKADNDAIVAGVANCIKGVNFMQRCARCKAHLECLQYIHSKEGREGGSCVRVCTQKFQFLFWAKFYSLLLTL